MPLHTKPAYGGNIYFAQQRLSRSTVPLMAWVSFQSQSLNCAESIHVRRSFLSVWVFITGIKYNSNQVRNGLCFLYFEKIRILLFGVVYQINACRGSAEGEKNLHFILASAQPTRTNGATRKLKEIFPVHIFRLSSTFHMATPTCTVSTCTSLTRQSLLACTLNYPVCVLHWPHDTQAGTARKSISTRPGFFLAAGHFSPRRGAKRGGIRGRGDDFWQRLFSPPLLCDWDGLVMGWAPCPLRRAAPAERDVMTNSPVCGHNPRKLLSTVLHSLHCLWWNSFGIRWIELDDSQICIKRILQKNGQVSVWHNFFFGENQWINQSFGWIFTLECVGSKYWSTIKSTSMSLNCFFSPI